MAENIIGKDLISLLRGEPLFGKTTNIKLGSYPSDKMLSGRFFTTKNGCVRPVFITANNLC